MRQPSDSQRQPGNAPPAGEKAVLELDSAVKSLKSLRIDFTDASRRHLALQCRQERPSFWSALAFHLEGIRPIRLPMAAGAVALFLAFGVAFLLVERQNPVDTVNYTDSNVRLVRVLPDASGGVTLVWKDGPKRTYKVMKSTDPSNFNGAETYAVRGNRWTDDSPSRGEVVYYKVE